MKIHKPLFESVKLEEKWIKEFQQLSKYDQSRLRNALVKYKIDIENSDFVLYNPQQLDSRAEQLKSPQYKVLFLCQKKDEKTGKPGPVTLLGIYSEGKFIDEFSYAVRGDDVFYDYYGNEVTPSNKGKTVAANMRQRRYLKTSYVPAPPVDLKYLSRKEIVKISRYIVVMSVAAGGGAIKSSAPIQAQRAAAKKGMVTREPLYFNPADNKYYTKPNFDKYYVFDGRYSDKSGFKTRAYDWQDKLKKYRQDKTLSQGDSKIIDDAISVYQKLVSKVSMAPGITSVPQGMNDMLYAMRSFASDLQDYFNSVESVKRRPNDDYYQKEMRSRLLDIPKRTAEMQKYAA